jgi:hypothetical protein
METIAEQDSRQTENYRDRKEAEKKSPGISDGL